MHNVPGPNVLSGGMRFSWSGGQFCGSGLTSDSGCTFLASTGARVDNGWRGSRWGGLVRETKSDCLMDSRAMTPSKKESNSPMVLVESTIRPLCRSSMGCGSILRNRHCFLIASILVCWKAIMPESACLQPYPPCSRHASLTLRHLIHRMSAP